MSIRVFANGQIHPPETAQISVFDRGFLYGESVYETVGTIHGRLFALAEHLDRLGRSASLIGLQLPPRSEIEDAVSRTLAAAANEESRVRIIVTAGGLASTPGQRFDPIPNLQGQSRLIVIVQPLNAPAPALYDNGVAVEVVRVTRNIASALDPAIKSGNYLNNVLALREARSRRPDAHEAILCNAEGYVAEGATSNVFVVSAGVLQTPCLDVGILNGVTRGKVLALARDAGIPNVESRFTAAEFCQADEAFLTSAARGVLPVTLINGVAVGDGRPGTITKQLMALYRELAEGRLALKGTEER